MFSRLIVLSGLIATAYAARPLPDVPIPTPDGRQIDLKQYRGKVVTLALISTQCEECIGLMGLLSTLQKQYGPRGMQAVVAAINDDARTEIGPLAQRYRPGYPVGFLDRDAAMKIAALAPGTRPVVPILMFIDRKGVVRFQYFGNDQPMKDGEKFIRTIMTGLINEDPNKPARTITQQAPVPH
jgi:AhpC/TSA family protein